MIPTIQLRSAMLLGALALLTACAAQSKIQTSYIRQQNNCREEAQNASSPVADENAAAAADPANSLAVHFSECMNRAGWHVAVPKTPGSPGTPVAQNPTSPRPDALNPSFPPAISAAAAAPAPDAAAKSAPAVAAPAEAPAAYQPAQPIAGSTGYGAVGRQF